MYYQIDIAKGSLSAIAGFFFAHYVPFMAWFQSACMEIHDMANNGYQSDHITLVYVFLITVMNRASEKVLWFCNVRGCPI